jgi:NADH-quinone oxidoreductase subunit M
MTEFGSPWVALTVVVPVVGAICVGRVRDRASARKWTLLFAGLALASSLSAWVDFVNKRGGQASEQSGSALLLFGHSFLGVDELNAPLLPLTAFLYLLTASATLRTKMRRYSFSWNLASEAIVLATLSCKEPWGIIALLAAGTVPPYLELRSRRKPTSVFTLHMGLFVCLLALGWTVVEIEGRTSPHSWAALVPLLGAIFIRCGLAPAHCWMTDLFEHATFGRALLFVLPMPGTYAAVRLVLPISPDWVLHSLGMVALFTALYAAGMALVQREARRFFCYLFISHSALVLVGMDTIRPIGLTGALCVWLSIGLGLAGFGLTLRALESRHGRLSLNSFHGLYEHTPALAVCFLMTGLASIGFPGTFGFVGTELLVDGAVRAFPYVGVAVVVVAALNGIAVVQAYLLLFTGTRHVTSVPLGIGRRERFATLALAVLILGGGLFPQEGVSSRYQAAQDILKNREAIQARDSGRIARLGWFAGERDD